MTFNESLRDFIKDKMAGKIPTEYILKVVSDFKTKDLKADEVVIVVSDGNATRYKAETYTFLTASLSILCFLPVNFKNEFKAVLEALADDLSAPLTNFNVGDYYAVFNLNSPGADGVPHSNINGIKFVTMNIFGSVNYTSEKNLLNNKVPNVYIDGKLLKNLTAYSPVVSPSYEMVTSIGKRYRRRFLEFENLEYSLSIILDDSDELHQFLHKMAERSSDSEDDYQKILVLRLPFRAENIGDTFTAEVKEFSGYFSSTMSISKGEFASLQIIVAR